MSALASNLQVRLLSICLSPLPPGTSVQGSFPTPCALISRGGGGTGVSPAPRPFPLSIFCLFPCPAQNAPCPAALPGAPQKPGSWPRGAGGWAVTWTPGDTLDPTGMPSSEGRAEGTLLVQKRALWVQGRRWDEKAWPGPPGPRRTQAWQQVSRGGGQCPAAWSYCSSLGTSTCEDKAEGQGRLGGASSRQCGLGLGVRAQGGLRPGKAGTIRDTSEPAFSLLLSGRRQCCGAGAGGTPCHREALWTEGPVFGPRAVGQVGGAGPERGVESGGQGEGLR